MTEYIEIDFSFPEYNKTSPSEIGTVTPILQRDDFQGNLDFFNERYLDFFPGGIDRN